MGPCPRRTRRSRSKRGVTMFAAAPPRESYAPRVLAGRVVFPDSVITGAASSDISCRYIARFAARTVFEARQWCRSRARAPSPRASITQRWRFLRMESVWLITMAETYSAVSYSLLMMAYHSMNTKMLCAADTRVNMAAAGYRASATPVCACYRQAGSHEVVFGEDNIRREAISPEHTQTPDISDVVGA